jgi:citrate lyase subunit beta/citryl-CoA lyase
MAIGPYRSMLFVPGQRGGWARKALASGADAIILDLEDAVPDAEKAAGRETVVASLRELRADPPQDTDVWVRPNSWDSRLAGLDLEAVVRPGLTGLVLPKLLGPEDVMRFDAVLTHCEIRNGVPEGSIKLIASLETPRGMATCEAIAAASPRMVSMIGATARDADTARSLGFQFTEEGLETLYLRSRILLACRAAELAFAICGIWQDIRDLEGLHRFAMRQRQLGYDGMVMIHPSHVGPVHEVFTPSEQELAFYGGMIAAFERGEAEGHASVDYDGQHIDRAHYQTAKAIVGRARPAAGATL